MSTSKKRAMPGGEDERSPLEDVEINDEDA
jgi:hypothetical protein